MKYLGSKEKISGAIVSVLQRIIYENNITDYVEPFVGGANVINKICCQHRYGYDVDKLVIALHKKAVEEPEIFKTLPQEVSKYDYYYVRDSGHYQDWYKAAILFFASYNARAYGGCYGAEAITKDGEKRNYYKEALNNYLAQIPTLTNIEFDCKDYRGVKIPFGSLVYCDIPYKNSVGYCQDFDHDAFWNWARELSKSKWCTVVVSEYEAPSDFKCIWDWKVKSHLNNRNKLEKTEKLFMWRED